MDSIRALEIMKGRDNIAMRGTELSTTTSRTELRTFFTDTACAGAPPRDRLVQTAFANEVFMTKSVKRGVDPIKFRLQTCETPRAVQSSKSRTNSDWGRQRPPRARRRYIDYSGTHCRIAEVSVDRASGAIKYITLSRSIAACRAPDNVLTERKIAVYGSGLRCGALTSKTA